MTTSAIMYLRCSTTDQMDSGLGIAAQRAACLRYAKTHDLEVVDQFQDDASGADGIDKRPGLRDAILGLNQGVVLLVAKMDRLSRDEMIFAWIETKVLSRGAKIMSAAGDAGDETPMGKAMRGISKVFAILERDLIRDRTRAALAAAKERGQKTGGRYAPYGYRVELKQREDGKNVKMLVEDENEQKMLAMVKGWRARGITIARCCELLEDNGFKPRGGGQWWPKVVHKMHATYAAS